MTQLPNAEALLKASKEALDKAVVSTNEAFETLERLAALNLTAARDAVEHSAKSFKESLGAKSPKEAAEFISSQVKPSIERGVAYVKSLQDIMTPKNLK
jgi:phasin family protein